MDERDKCLKASGLEKTPACTGTVVLGISVAMVTMGMSLDDMKDHITFLDKSPGVTIKPVEQFQKPIETLTLWQTR